MKALEIKKLLIRSLEPDADPAIVSRELEKAGVKYNFSQGFSEKVLSRIYSEGSTVIREVDFVKSLNNIFYRIALTGVAAIVILLISIFLMEGSLSFNSFIGLSDTYDESIVCLLTGN